jgi:hypothetical protein
MSQTSGVGSSIFAEDKYEVKVKLPCLNHKKYIFKLILKSVLDGEADILKEREQSSKQQRTMEKSNATRVTDVGSTAGVSIFILS